MRPSQVIYSLFDSRGQAVAVFASQAIAIFDAMARTGHCYFLLRPELFHRCDLGMLSLFSVQVALTISIPAFGQAIVVRAPVSRADNRFFRPWRRAGCRCFASAPEKGFRYFRLCFQGRLSLF